VLVPVHRPKSTLRSPTPSAGRATFFGCPSFLRPEKFGSLIAVSDSVRFFSLRALPVVFFPPPPLHRDLKSAFFPANPPHMLHLLNYIALYVPSPIPPLPKEGVLASSFAPNGWEWSFSMSLRPAFPERTPTGVSVLLASFFGRSTLLFFNVLQMCFSLRCHATRLPSPTTCMKRFELIRVYLCVILSLSFHATK